VFGGAEGISCRGIHHDDPLAGRRIFIDVVGSYAGSNDRFELAVAFERLGGDFYPAANNRPIE
jgi:hypothetical protein